MSANTITLRGQQRALALLMVDACTITRLASTTTNPETGATVETTTPVYSGVCRVSEKAKNARPDTVGEAQIFLFRLQLQLPLSALDVRIDDRVTLTASALDPALVGRKFFVREAAHASHITARRIQIEEIQS